ncbi:MAG: hypothetical protein WC375_08650, partial [Methanomassiliicoccales archaeon]|jgi:hypothetical protein
MEYQAKGIDTDEEGIPEIVIVDAIQFLHLWAVFEQLRRKGLIDITGDGLLCKHYTTFFNLTEKGQLVNKYLKVLIEEQKMGIKNNNLPINVPKIDITNGKAISVLQTLNHLTSNGYSISTTQDIVTTTTTTLKHKKPRKKKSK